MKTILVPTDFSKGAEHAMRYAISMNQFFKARIVLHHSYVIPVYATDLPVIMPVDVDLHKVAVDGLSKLRDRLAGEFPELQLEMSVTSGYAEEEIAEAAEKWKADLVVMGTQGASGLREALIGTITAAVMEKSPCPVLAVPSDAAWRGVRRIVFATSYEEGDFGNIEQVIGFAKKLSADVTLLHISSGLYDQAYEYNAIERFKESIAEDSHFSRITFKLLEGEDVYQSINFYLDEVKADMIAMTMRHRSFIRKIFGRSITKKMAYHTHIPLIAFRSGGS